MKANAQGEAGTMAGTQDTADRRAKANEDQSTAIQFLEKGAGHGTPAKRVDTHGAMIFLIGQEAFKIKRAIKYDYMDLSTVEKRHALLVRELELNKDAVPSIYRDVVPLVRKADGSLAIGARGDVLEWVLRMNRFSQEAELIHIAKERGIDDELAARLGTAIARYHAKAPVKQESAHALIRDILDELDRVFGTMHDALGADAVAFLAASRTLLSDQADALKLRSRLGHIRRCHGDLHLRNIIVVDGVPTPFDALEFDERLGTCDTLYDLAFLLMDLDHLKLAHAANLVLNAYLFHSTQDMKDTGLTLLPLYLAIRAAIRAMVDVQTSNVAQAGHTKNGEARTYLAQALGYLDPPAPVLVAFGGYSGTGKTTIACTVAHLIGASPGAVHIRSDVTRKTLLHRDPLDPLGPDGYTADITERTYQAIRNQAARVLDQGHSAILDAVHSDPDARNAAEQTARVRTCRFIGIWLESPTRTRLARVAVRPPDASDADAAVVQKQDTDDPGRISWHKISTDRPIDAVVSDVSVILQSLAADDNHESGDRNVG